MVGTHIAHYQITAKLGQGGMGEVYRATDTKLDREVAIKVLPKSFAQNNERLARFEREAKTLATLNHPNIAGIYGLEHSGNSQALILELVEGEDLSQRLKRGALSMEETLEICKQIAEALEAAHGKDIIHRDLKPANIKVSTDGKVKVLDFGLAKALSEESESSSFSNTEDSPTITDAFTQPGTILGTAAYMSPEQARGKHLDKRTDIWAFGCILFECLTGTKVFRGEDATEILAGVIKDEPRWDLIPASLPIPMVLLLKKCLTKDRRHRLHDIADARVDLQQAQDKSIHFPFHNDGTDPTVKTGQRIPGAMLVIVLILTTLLAWKWNPKDKTNDLDADETPLRSELQFKTETPFFTLFYNHGFCISNDGNHVVYGLSESKRTLYHRNLITGKDGVIPGLENLELVCSPFFSPDGQWIAFIDHQGLIRIRLEGGTPERLFTTQRSQPFPASFNGADWSRNDDIVFAENGNPLRLISANGGTPVYLTSPAEDEHPVSPQFIGDGSHVLYLVKEDVYSHKGRAMLLDLKTKTSTPLDIPLCQDVRYLASGHMIYTLGSEVFSIPFDLNTLSPVGSKTRVLSGVQSFGRSQFDVSEQGDLIYLEGEQKSKVTTSLAWFWEDSNGRLQAEPFTTQRGDWSDFALAPDQKRVVIIIDNNLWLLDCLDRNDLPPIPMVDQEKCLSPVWSQDGRFVYYYSGDSGKHRVRRIDMHGPANAGTTLFESETHLLLPDSVSDDRLWLTRGNETENEVNTDIWYLPLTVPNAKAESFLKTTFREEIPAVSPNAKWMAYVSDETSTTQIHMARLNNTARSNVFTSKGGHIAKWSADGSTLVWLQLNQFHATKVSEQDQQLRMDSNETEWFWYPELIRGSAMEVSTDGTRVLILSTQADIKQFEDNTFRQSTHLNLVTHWFSELPKASSTPVSSQ